MTKIDTLTKRSRDLLHSIQFSRFGHRCPCCHLPTHSVKCLLRALLQDLDDALAVKPTAEKPKSHKNSGKGE